MADETTTGVIMVFSNPVPGREAEYDDWYQNVHLPQVCATPGISSAQRFRLVSGGTAAGPANVAVYRLDGNPKQVSAEMSARARSGAHDMTDAIDRSRISVQVWESHGDPVSG